ADHLVGHDSGVPGLGQAEQAAVTSGGVVDALSPRHIDIGIVSQGTCAGTTMIAAPRSASAAAVEPIVIALKGRSFSMATRVAITSIHGMLITPSAKSAAMSAPLQPTQNPPCSIPIVKAPPRPGLRRSSRESRQWSRHVLFAAVSS